MYFLEYIFTIALMRKPYSVWSIILFWWWQTRSFLGSPKSTSELLLPCFDLRKLFQESTYRSLLLLMMGLRNTWRRSILHISEINRSLGTSSFSFLSLSISFELVFNLVYPHKFALIIQIQDPILKYIFFLNISRWLLLNNPFHTQSLTGPQNPGCLLKTMSNK